MIFVNICPKTRDIYKNHVKAYPNDSPFLADAESDIIRQSSSAELHCYVIYRNHSIRFFKSQR